jgi:calcineurin-like phosphoesterase
MRALNILFIGDVVGHVGLRELLRNLPSLRETYRPDCIIVNGENIVDGKGLSDKEYTASLRAITFGRTGRHVRSLPQMRTCSVRSITQVKILDEAGR